MRSKPESSRNSASIMHSRQMSESDSVPRTPKASSARTPALNEIGDNAIEKQGRASSKPGSTRIDMSSTASALTGEVGKWAARGTRMAAAHRRRCRRCAAIHLPAGPHNVGSRLGQLRARAPFESSPDVQASLSNSLVRTPALGSTSQEDATAGHAGATTRIRRYRGGEADSHLPSTRRFRSETESCCATASLASPRGPFDRYVTVTLLPGIPGCANYAGWWLAPDLGDDPLEIVHRAELDDDLCPSRLPRLTTTRVSRRSDSVSATSCNPGITICLRRGVGAFGPSPLVGQRHGLLGRTDRQPLGDDRAASCS